MKKSVKLLIIPALMVGFAGILLAGGLDSTLAESGFLKKLHTSLDSYMQNVKEERVYLQLDKSLYKPGETIWFQAYLSNTSDMRASTASDIVHVEFINPKGNIEKHLKLIMNEGSAGGDFILPEVAAGGMYKIKAYTLWQKNDTSNLVFEKTIQVQSVILPKLAMKLDFDRKAYGPGENAEANVEVSSLDNQPLANYKFSYSASLDGQAWVYKEASTDEFGKAVIKLSLPGKLKSPDGLLNVMIPWEGSTESISRSIPITLNQIKLSFYPEGGDMVAGLSNKLAFKAINEFGKPADAEGNIICDGKVAAHFRTYHNGMGATTFTPEEGNTYTAKITKPANITESYAIPEAFPKGFNMQVSSTADSKKLHLNIGSTEIDSLHLIATVRNKVFYTGSFLASVGQNNIEVSLKDFPMGVCRLTLFDGRGIERAERLAFVNKAKHVKLSISTDKQKYTPREKVTMTIRAQDERGLPVPTRLSLAVVDEKLLSFADDKDGSIFSKLFLEPEVTGKVEEAAFYFKDNEPKADTALDYVMLTSGWRHFSWKQVVRNNPSNNLYQPEKSVVSGVIFKDYTGQPFSGVSVIAKIGTKTLNTETDKDGKYSFKVMDYSQPLTLTASAKGYAPSNQAVYFPGNNYNINIYDTKTRVYYDNVPQAAGGKMEQEIVMAAPPEMQKMKRDRIVGRVDRIEAKQIKHLAKVDDIATVVKEKGDVPKKEVVKKPAQGAILQGFAEGANAKANRRGRKNKMDMEENLNGDIGLMAEDIPMANANEDFDEAYRTPEGTFYRHREFPAPDYSKGIVGERNDFRTTIYWKGDIETGRNGAATISFYTCDEISSFRATVEGMSQDGLAAHGEAVFYTQMPFSLSAKIPEQASMGDELLIPVVLKNNTSSFLTGKLDIKIPESWKSMDLTVPAVSVIAGGSQTIYLKYAVQNKPGKGDFNLAFRSQGMEDGIRKEVITGMRGFPVLNSFSDREMDKDYTVDINNVVNGTLSASLTVYPSSVKELMSGVAALLQEPSGCFEQTSSSNYPNIMALQLLQETKSDDKATLARAKELLDHGYKKLVVYETSQKGYEWFGSAPAHEALTAYGIMEFNDMKNVYPNIDGKMVERTANWLLARRDCKGGFQRSSKAIDAFGSASPEVTDAYIVYALAEAGQTNLKSELDAITDEALKSNDAYRLALAANAQLRLKGNKAQNVINALLKKQSAGGSWDGAQHSITRSGGQALKIESTSLALLALMQNETEHNAVEKGVKWLVQQRSGLGGFYNTQSTVLALKALSRYAIISRHTPEAGTVSVIIDGKKASEQHFEANAKGDIVISGLEQYLGNGKHNLKVKFSGMKEPLPYTLRVDWRTSLPQTDKDCRLNLETKFVSAKSKTGSTLRMNMTLKNKTDQGLASPIAIIGIPAGLSVQPWQLKELQEKKVFDYYEVKGSNLILYYRQMTPSEIKTVNLDLKAEVAGTYESPASCAYEYYTNEHKSWCKAGTLTVER